MVIRANTDGRIHDISVTPNSFFFYKLVDTETITSTDGQVNININSIVGRDIAYIDYYFIHIYLRYNKASGTIDNFAEHNKFYSLTANDTANSRVYNSFPSKFGSPVVTLSKTGHAIFKYALSISSAPSTTYLGLNAYAMGHWTK